MRAASALVIVVLVARAADAEDLPDPEAIWHSTAPEHLSTARWVCSSLNNEVIEFRSYPKLLHQNPDLWVIRDGQTFMYAFRAQEGLEAHFVLEASSHQIHIGADRVARYYAFSGEEGEWLQPSAIWVGCKETR